MRSSESIKNIGLALSKFQSEVESIDRNSKGYNYKYASLENVLETIRKPLENAGLTFAQFPTGDYGLTTILIHPESGEFFETTSEIKPKQDDPQGRGSAITYNRRYHLVSILGLIVEDDDGVAATGKPNKPSAPQSTGKELPWLNEGDKVFSIAIQKLKNNETTIEKIKESYKLAKATEEKLRNA